SAGSSTGVSYATSADADVAAWDTDTTGALQPSAKQSPAGVSGALAVLVKTSSGPPPAPTVSALSVPGGPSSGGTTVVVSGTNLTGATAVTFGTVAATTFSVGSATSITATAPAFTPSATTASTTVDVTVSANGTTSATSQADQFTYSYAGTGGGACTGTCSVSLTANTASSPVVLNEPTGTTGNSVVGLTATASQSVSGLGDGLSILDVSTSPPTVVAQTATGSTLTTSVSRSTAGTARYVGEIDDCPGGGPVNPTTCPLAPIFATSAPALVTWWQAPAVSAVNPSSGPSGGGTSVTISGSGFTGASAVQFGATPATFTVTGPSSITATAPPGSGTVDVTVTGPGGSSATSPADEFTYSTTPVPVTAVGSLANASGEGTTTLADSPQRTGDLVVLALKTSSSTVTASTVSGGGVGSWRRIEGPYTGYAGNDMELWAGTVTSSGPSTVSVAFSASVTSLYTGIAAQEFSATGWSLDTGGGIVNASSTAAAFPKLTPSATNELYFGYDEIAQSGSAGTSAGFSYATTADADVVAYDTTVSAAVQPSAAETPAGTSGGVAVLIAASGSSTTAGLTVAGVSPSSGFDSGGTTVTITGSGFSGVTKVDFGSVPAAFVTNSATQITATSPPGADGTVDVTVGNSSGSSATSAADQFINVTTKASSVPLGVLPPVGGDDPAAVAAWGQTTGTHPTLALDYLPKNEGWSGMDSTSTLSGWTGSGYRLVLAVPIIPTDASGTAQGTLAQGATGAYNQYFTTLAQNLVSAGLGNAILRLGWEFNGTWYAWSVASATDAANFAAYWRQIVTTMRAAEGADFTFFWNPNGPSPTSYSPSQAYPGNAYVDYVGTDDYDNYWGTPFTPQAGWANQLSQQWGFNWLASFAAQNDKPMAIAEWSDEYDDTGNGFGDDPSFIDNMANWFVANDVAFTDVFSYDSSSAYRNDLTDGTFPHALAEFERIFG
ncbi:MAG TPA: IPT/TIG domain-containing protein, partial [Acidimicrobiales bacterium]|nr:IPT/TIG domain-containing protein [Acidimicrobiales bacterium]